MKQIRKWSTKNFCEGKHFWENILDQSQDLFCKQKVNAQYVPLSKCKQKGNKIYYCSFEKLNFALKSKTKKNSAVFLIADKKSNVLPVGLHCVSAEVMMSRPDWFILNPRISFFCLIHEKVIFRGKTLKSQSITIL